VAVIFVDGVDGAGKTTLINQLAAHIWHPSVRIAPPLWSYLPMITDPSMFAGWVTSTDPLQVATALLTAQTERIDEIHAQVTGVRPAPMVLVDRGATTVIASARAHLLTTAEAGNAHAEPSWLEQVGPAVARLRAAARRLSTATDCVALELSVTDYRHILSRLSSEDRDNRDYVRYLHTFLAEFQTIERPPDTRRLTLDATAPPEDSLRTALTWTE